jgi:hypothetical protein
MHRVRLPDGSCHQPTRLHVHGSEGLWLVTCLPRPIRGHSAGNPLPSRIVGRTALSPECGPERRVHDCRLWFPCFKCYVCDESEWGARASQCYLRFYLDFLSAFLAYFCFSLLLPVCGYTTPSRFGIDTACKMVWHRSGGHACIPLYTRLLHRRADYLESRLACRKILFCC